MCSIPFARRLAEFRVCSVRNARKHFSLGTGPAKPPESVLSFAAAPPCFARRLGRTSLFRSVRIVRRRSSLRTLRSKHPKALPTSRSLRSDRPKAIFPSHASLVLPEGISSAALARFRSPESNFPFAPIRLNRPKAIRPSRLLHPVRPKALRISLRSASLTRRPALLSGSGRRGRARSSEDSQHSRPPAAYEEMKPKLPSFVSLPRLLLPSPVARFRQRYSAATHEWIRPKASPFMSGPSVCVVRPVRLRVPNLIQRGLTSHFKITSVTLRLRS